MRVATLAIGPQLSSSQVGCLKAVHGARVAAKESRGLRAGHIVMRYVPDDEDAHVLRHHGWDGRSDCRRRRGGRRHGRSRCGAVGPSTAAALVTNGVALSRETFADIVQDLVAFNFAQDCSLPLEALATTLEQRAHSGLKIRTPYKLEKFVINAVRLEGKIMHCCRNGCMAYTAKHVPVTSCHFCKVERFKSKRKPAKTTRYWKIAPWMAMMLVDSDIGPDMIKLNEVALADADKKRTVFQDF